MYSGFKRGLFYVLNLFFSFTKLILISFGDKKFESLIIFNTDKYHHLIPGNNNEYMWAKLDQDVAWESCNIELFGVKIDVLYL